MVDWTEKYHPSTLSEIRGNNKARDALTEWAKTWDDHREAVVVHGSPGIGKTSAAHALAADMGWETVELNASDQRTGDVIERFAGRAVKNVTLAGSSAGTSTRQLVILDEADNIHGNYNRGGVSAVTRLVRSLSQPIVLTANEFYDMNRGLRNACQKIEFRDVSARSIVPVLHDICRKEGLEFESDALDHIAGMNSGDLRSVVNDFQTVAEGRKKVTEEDMVMGDRDRSVGLFELLDVILKEESAQDALCTAYDVDETPDDLTKWVEDKVSLVYEPGELAHAYNFLANANRWLGRVRATQNYSYWRYTTDNLAAGVAASRDRARGGWTRHGGVPYRSTRDKTHDTVVRKIAQNGGFSMATVRHEALSYLSATTHHCKSRKLTVAITAYYEFDESRVSFITGSDETTNKVRSIAEDADEPREELVEEHAAGASASIEGVSADDDAAADDGDDGTDDAPDRDADTDADELAESDDSDAVTNDGQSGLDDFF